MQKKSLNKIAFVGVLLSTTLLLGACTQLTPSKESPSKKNEPAPTMAALTGYKKYDNATEKLSFQYPDKWEMQEGFMGTLVFVKSPQADSKDTFQENVNVMVQSLGGQKVTLAQFADSAEKQITSMITEAEIVEPNSDTTLAGNSAKKIVYTGQQGQYNLKWQQIYFIKGDKAYVVTYTAQAPDYDKYLPEVENILKSLQIE